ncbi:MAG: glutamine-hydrolyzing GMP synthase [Candidatus Lokiarchaeota archaeon]|nr:glutamine-hydrolyzing GMP synthase [Candidatus Lokiarchaeota archaeon]
MDKIYIIDMGSQYSHLIARRVRELGVYSEIIPPNISISELMVLSPKGIILSGGPSSVYEENSPKLEESFYEYIKAEGIPILGICYGLHLIIHQLGGKIEPNEKKEYGKTELEILDFDSLFSSLDKKEIVWMSHGDQISQMPDGFKILAKTNTCPIAAFGNEKLNIYGVQFHPEVVHTAKGTKILKNFIYNIADAKNEWKLENWIETTIDSIKEEVGAINRVILGLSGGVDSSVCAALLHKAIGDRLHCIFVNNGVLRKNEEFEVQKQFREKMNLKNFHYVNAESLFLEKLKDVDDPEEKRRIIGHTFIEVFEKKTIELETKYPSIKYLAQGTIYPDRVETAATSKNAAKIKSHHNLTLPEDMKLKIIEPLKDLYKDEVRKIGKQLGLEPELIDRHPFPGPGLAVRCVGAIDKEKLEILREADSILLEEIRKAGIYNDLWQVFCVFLPVKTVGVMGDFRTYEYICSIRAVESKDVMTASFAKLEWDLLEKIGTRIINEVKGFNRVVYDISNKPPSTIEYE